MCVYSMVLDQFGPLIPPLVPDPIVPAPRSPFTPHPFRWGPITPPPQTTPVQLTPDQLQKIIDAFHEMMAAAKKVDEAVGHKNCEDPDKAKLEARVAELEEALANLRKHPKRKRGARKVTAKRGRK